MENIFKKELTENLHKEEFNVYNRENNVVVYKKLKDHKIYISFGINIKRKEIFNFDLNEIQIENSYKVDVEDKYIALETSIDYPTNIEIIEKTIKKGYKIAKNFEQTLKAKLTEYYYEEIIMKMNYECLLGALLINQEYHNELEESDDKIKVLNKVMAHAEKWGDSELRMIPDEVNYL